MSRAFVALGANLGDRLATISSALRRLNELGTVVRLSSIYETEPYGYADQPQYLNAVAEIETDLMPGTLLDGLLRIETEHGRERSFPNAPRTLDLDLLLYGDEEVAKPRLTIPHPRLRERGFVLVPLAEIASEVIVPGIGATVRELKDRLGRTDDVRKISGPPPEPSGER